MYFFKKWLSRVVDSFRDTTLELGKSSFSHEFSNLGLLVVGIHLHKKLYLLLIFWIQNPPNISDEDLKYKKLVLINAFIGQSFLNASDVLMLDFHHKIWEIKKSLESGKAHYW